MISRKCLIWRRQGTIWPIFESCDLINSTARKISPCILVGSTMPSWGERHATGRRLCWSPRLTWPLAPRTRQPHQLATLGTSNLAPPWQGPELGLEIPPGLLLKSQNLSSRSGINLIKAKSAKIWWVIILNHHKEISISLLLSDSPKSPAWIDSDSDVG